ncbi:hypothetical protein LX36DRAFT_657578 [Colletotrichum falcatum]|nr:hypothetical protein LX36DRAFT_657578 [Colletotrichum falcatum]
MLSRRLLHQPVAGASRELEHPPPWHPATSDAPLGHVPFMHGGYIVITMPINTKPTGDDIHNTFTDSAQRSSRLVHPQSSAVPWGYPRWIALFLDDANEMPRTPPTT